MNAALRRLILDAGGFSPYRLPGNEAIYSVEGGESPSTYITNGLGRVKLISDRSGNSAVNCLVLNGAAGNYASAPDSVPLSVTGDIDIRVRGAMVDWTPAANSSLVAKWNATGDQRSYSLSVQTDGTLLMGWSATGTATTIDKSSTAAVPVSDGAAIWVRATLDVDNGAAGNTVSFYTSTDGVTWTPLGSPVVTAGTTAIYDGTSDFQIGSRGGIALNTGNFYGVQVRSGIDGTIVFDADFTKQAKLAATFTEDSANAATVTINTSGDLGARISGARDLVQLTTLKMPLLGTAADGKPIATFDGSNDYMKAAPFSLSQPESTYSVISQETWTLGDVFFDGNAASSGRLYQASSSPLLRITADGINAVEDVAGISTATRFVASAVLNGASSSIRINKRAATLGNAGTGNLGGFTIGAKGDGSTPANETFSETIVASRGDSDSLQLRINSALMRKWNVAA